MPDRCVVDTDVVSYFFKRDTRAALYRPHLTDKLLMLSFMTVAELERWSLERNWGPDRRQRLDTYLGRFTIQPSNRALCQLWARVIVQARRQGRPIQPADARIAATALLHDIPLVSHNRQDYAGVGNLVVISEDGAR